MWRTPANRRLVGAAGLGGSKVQLAEEGSSRSIGSGNLLQLLEIARAGTDIVFVLNVIDGCVPSDMAVGT